jgi:hypothetical protein
MKDDYKKIIPSLAIDSKFFHHAFANPCKTKGAAGAVCAMAIRFLIANYCWRRHCNFKGLSQAGKRAKLAEISTPLPLIKNYRMRPL